MEYYFENAFNTIRDTGYAHGVLHDKTFAVVAIDLSQGRIMIALENDGCYVHPGFEKPVFDTDLMGAGFDPFTAPLVANILRELLEWLQRRPDGNAEVRLIGETK